MFKVGMRKMLASADKVGGWGQNDQKHADVILEWSLRLVKN